MTSPSGVCTSTSPPGWVIWPITTRDSESKVVFGEGEEPFVILAAEEGVGVYVFLF